jgi:hypothetical protein
MQRLRPITLGWLLALILASQAAAQGGARTPEQLIAELLAAAKRNDADAVLSLIAPQARSALEASAPGRYSMFAIDRPFNQALDARFGRGQTMATVETIWPSRTSDLIAALSRIDALKVVAIGRQRNGLVPIEVGAAYRNAQGEAQATKGVLLAQRDRDGWKIALAGAADPDAATARREEEGMIAAEVERGAYKDRLSAMIALSDLWAKEAAK